MFQSRDSRAAQYHLHFSRHPLKNVRHGPNRLITIVAFTAFLRIARDVQERVRGSSTHHPSALVANCGRKIICRSIKEPCDDPLRSNGNSGARFIGRIGVASLCGAAEHVDHSQGSVRRLWLFLNGKFRASSPIATDFGLLPSQTLP